MLHIHLTADSGSAFWRYPKTVFFDRLEHTRTNPSENPGFEIALTNLKYNAFMPAIRVLDIQSTAFDETDDGLEPAWLLLSPEERLRQHRVIIECGLKLEEAIKGIQIPRTIDRSVKYDILRDAF